MNDDNDTHNKNFYANPGAFLKKIGEDELAKKVAELIENVKISLNGKRNYLCSFEIAKSKRETLRDNAKDNDLVESCEDRSISQNNQSES